MEIKLGIEEPECSNFGMCILPIIEDLRSDLQIVDNFPSSLKIRKAMSELLRNCQGLNNKDPKTLQVAISVGMKTGINANIDWSKHVKNPKFIWPRVQEEESNVPLKKSCK